MSLPTAKEVVEAARTRAARLSMEKAQRDAADRVAIRKARWLGTVMFVVIVSLAFLIRR